MTSTALAGSTGLVGSHILTTLLSSPSISSVHAYTRRALPTTSPKLTPLLATDTSTWPTLFPQNPTPSIFISALGTTRAAAGSTAAQYTIDHDLNLSLATAARSAGANTYVLISSHGANSSSMMFYPRMKGELEDAVQKLGFEHVVILRPGLIVGERQEGRFAEGVLRGVANVAGAVWNGLKDPWAQDAQVIARAAVGAALECQAGKREKGSWVVGQSEIVRLGRTEWVE